MGFLGILEDNRLQHVPATVILSEQVGISAEAAVGLKHGTGKDADIVLIPQPCVNFTFCFLLLTIAQLRRPQ